MSNIFKANNKDTKTMPMSLLTYFTPGSSVSIVNFEQVNAGWVVYILMKIWLTLVYYFIRIVVNVFNIDRMKQLVCLENSFLVTSSFVNRASLFVYQIKN